MKKESSMKERVLFLCKFFGVALCTIMASLLIFLSPVLARGITPPCIAPTSYHIARMHWLEKRGEMGWSGEIEDAVQYLSRCRSDTASLAKRLLADSSGTVVSLGMDIVVRESFENGNELLQRHDDDKRWNHNLALNDEYARFLLVLWKIQKGLPLTVEDEEIMSGWSIGYFERVGVIPPDESSWMSS
jgi:hypothetical protein